MRVANEDYREKLSTVIDIVNSNFMLPPRAIANILNASGYKTSTGKDWTSKNLSGFIKDNHCKSNKESPSIDIKDKEIINKIIYDNKHLARPKIAEILNSMNLKTINGLEWTGSTVNHYAIRYLNLNSRYGSSKTETEQEQDEETLPKYEITQLVFAKDGKFLTDSLMVASIFQKKHQHILRDIKELNCSEKFRLSNFGQSEYINERGRVYPKFLMTKDGFTKLVFKFTDDKSTEFQEIYIEQFNKMEEILKNQQSKQQIKPPTYSEALRLLADNLEKNQILETENKKQSEEIKELLPQSLLLNVFTSTSELKTLRQIGYKLKPYGLGPKKIFEFLRNHKVIILSNGENYPTHAYTNLLKIETIVKRWVDKNTGEEKSKAFDILKAHTGFYKILAGLLVNDKILTINQFNMIDFNNVPKDEQIYGFVEKVG